MLIYKHLLLIKIYVQLKLSGNMSRKFDTNKFINDVLNDKYALVVGNEIILNKDIEVSGDVHQFLLRKVNEIYGTKYIAYEDIALDKSHHGRWHCKWYDGRSCGRYRCE